MHLHRFAPALFVPLMLLAITQAKGARAECDASYVRLSNDQLVTGTAAAQELAYSDSVHWLASLDPLLYWDGSGYVRIALATRRFEAASHSMQSLYFGGRARDEYRVVGAPAGAEITFRLRLVGTVEFVFYGYCGGSGCNPVAGITVDGVFPEHLEMIGIASYVDRVLPFDRSTNLTRRAGEPFTLDYLMQAGTSHSPAYASISARVEFDDLPPGVRVVSCLEEYLATDSRTGSWGSLKLRYR